jgi:hypothetical protein
MSPTSRVISGLGTETIPAIGTCEIVVVLPNVSIDVLFTVVPDNVMPSNLAAIIGWDVISRPNVKIKKGTDGLELHHDLSNTGNVLTIAETDAFDDLEVTRLAERDLARLKQLLIETREATPDHITTGKLTITLKDDIPVAYRPRRLAHAERTQVKEIVADLLQKGTIRESQSTYASPIVLVRKKNGEARLCVDYRDINKKTVRERYPLPLIRDLLDSLRHARYFTTLDMKSGFHQMEIDEGSKHITAFITPDGLYEYHRMPFGLVNAAAVYQRAIDKALGKLKGTEAHVYMDDVLVPSESIEEGLQRLENVLHALANAGFSLNYRKCTFLAEETEYLGVVISHGSVQPSPRKVSALVHSAVPSDVKAVRQFMGLASYFRRFIEGFSLITVPITTLLRKNHVFQWTAECENARQIIISKLVSKPVLRMFDPKLPCELHTDASALGVGAALLQKEHGVVRPIAYYSRRTTDCEAKYCSYDLETLAIVEAVEHFRAYLYGMHFTIFTDCNAIRATALKKDLHPRVARWWVKLQDYDFTIEYRPGSKMAHVDYLSRNPLDKVCTLRVTKPELTAIDSLRDY